MPNAKISWVVQEKAAGILEHQPFIETRYVLPDKFLQIKNWGRTKRIILELRKQRWDAIIDFQGLSKTSFLLWWLRGPKFGFDRTNCREALSSYFTDHHVTPNYTNIIQKNLALASEALSHLIQTNTCPTIDKLKQSLDLFVPSEKQKTVESWLNKNKLTRFITLAPNTTWQSKHWPLEHWQELVQLLSKANITTILLGKEYGEAASQLANRISQQNLPIHIAPKWDLPTTTYLLKKTTLLVAPDTGILHLADFLGTKAIGLFGPTLASRHGPFLTKKNITNTKQISCPHRYKKSHGTFDCMSNLTAEELFSCIQRDSSATI